MTAADVTRTISRIAHQIIEKTALDGPDAPRVVLLGIPTRGVTLAARLAERIETFSGVTVPHGGLDITLYRDDLDTKPPRPLEDTSIPTGGIDHALVILVDDVLYTGVRCVPLDSCATSAARTWCNSRCSSTAATASCRCAPTMSARTCRRRAVRTSRCGWPRPTRSRASGSHRTEGPSDERLREEQKGSALVTRHLLTAADLSRDEATAILDDADRFSQALLGREVKKLPTLRGRTVITMFYENSTRTRVSFEVAGKWMSADVINVSASGSSVAKGSRCATPRSRCAPRAPTR